MLVKLELLFSLSSMGILPNVVACAPPPACKKKALVGDFSFQIALTGKLVRLDSLKDLSLELLMVKVVKASCGQTIGFYFIFVKVKLSHLLGRKV